MIQLLGREIDDLRREHEQTRRELADLKTTYRDIEVRPIQALPQAPTLVPILGVNEEADTSATCPVEVVPLAFARAAGARCKNGPDVRSGPNSSPSQCRTSRTNSL